MLVLQWSTGTKIARFLGRQRHAFSPCKVVVDAAKTEISVSGDTAEVTLHATVERGKMLWFAKDEFGKATLRIPFSAGLPLELSGRLIWDGAKFSTQSLQVAGFGIALPDAALAASKANWIPGEGLKIILSIPCRTSSFLNQSEEVSGGQRIYRVQKSADFKDVEIRNYVWRIRLDEVAPFSSVAVYQHGELVDKRVDIEDVTVANYAVSDLSATSEGLVSGHPHHPVTATKELQIRLAFQEPNEQYKIVFAK